MKLIEHPVTKLLTTVPETFSEELALRYVSVNPPLLKLSEPAVVTAFITGYELALKHALSLPEHAKTVISNHR